MSGWVSYVTSPHEILPPFRLVGGGGGGAGRRSDQGSRKNTEEQCSVMSRPTYPNTGPTQTGRPKGTSHPAACPSQNCTQPRGRNKSKQSLWPCMLPHQANIASLFSHPILHLSNWTALTAKLTSTSGTIPDLGTLPGHTLDDEPTQCFSAWTHLKANDGCS